MRIHLWWHWAKLEILLIRVNFDDTYLRRALEFEGLLGLFGYLRGQNFLVLLFLKFCKALTSNFEWKESDRFSNFVKFRDNFEIGVVGMSKLVGWSKYCIFNSNDPIPRAYPIFSMIGCECDPRLLHTIPWKDDAKTILLGHSSCTKQSLCRTWIIAIRQLARRSCSADSGWKWLRSLNVK